MIQSTNDSIYNFNFEIKIKFSNFDLIKTTIIDFIFFIFYLLNCCKIF
jgi:hypothetical protein